jgi:Arc/MetJ family transcription regulator
MRTTIEIDDGLMARAMRISGARNKRAVVEAGLRLLVNINSQTAIRRLRGKVQFEGDLNESGLGRTPELRHWILTAPTHQAELIKLIPKLRKLRSQFRRLPS